MVQPLHPTNNYCNQEYITALNKFSLKSHNTNYSLHWHSQRETPHRPTWCISPVQWCLWNWPQSARVVVLWWSSDQFPVSHWAERKCVWPVGRSGLLVGSGLSLSEPKCSQGLLREAWLVLPEPDHHCKADSDITYTMQNRQHKSIGMPSKVPERHLENEGHCLNDTTLASS